MSEGRQVACHVLQDKERRIEPLEKLRDLRQRVVCTVGRQRVQRILQLFKERTNRDKGRNVTVGIPYSSW